MWLLQNAHIVTKSATLYFSLQSKNKILKTQTLLYVWHVCVCVCVCVRAAWWKHRINVHLFWEYPHQNMDTDEPRSLTLHWYRLHWLRHEYQTSVAETQTVTSVHYFSFLSFKQTCFTLSLLTVYKLICGISLMWFIFKL